MVTYKYRASSQGRVEVKEFPSLNKAMNQASQDVKEGKHIPLLISEGARNYTRRLMDIWWRDNGYKLYE